MPAKPKEAGPKRSFLEQYLDETHTHVYSLIAIIPLILIYEIGMLAAREYTWRDLGVMANEMLLILFAKLGAERLPILPALLVMGTVFVLQFRSGKRWDIRMSNVLLVHIEYILYGILFFACIAWLLPGSLSFRIPRSNYVILALGAAVYEEYIFRLVLLSLLMYVLEKLLKVDKQRRVFAAVVISALCFSAFHYGLGSEAFTWSDFLIRTAAGIYLGIIALSRTYGVAAGTHAAFNVLILLFAGTDTF